MSCSSKPALACGYPEKPDLIDPDGFGIGPAPRNGEADVRMSAALTHLQPARDRPNLEVRGDARVVRVRFEGRRATGVDVLGADGDTSFEEAREVILTSGAIETPHLLMTSGVGPGDALARNGIEVVADLPGVGKNVRDHPAVSLELDASPCLEEEPRHHVLLVYTAKGSPMRNDMNVLSSAFRVTDESGVDQPFFNMYAVLEAAESSGEISLSAPDPLEPPRIVLGYLESELDRRRLREGVRVTARLVDHPAFERIGVTRLGPADDVLASDGALDEWVAANLFTFFHTCGTCRMGDARDPGAVVDERGLVHGLGGLRIADLSIAPDVPRAATNATAFMIAERMADLCTSV